MFDNNSEQGLLEFIKRKANFVILMNLFILGEMPEYFGEFFCVGDEWVDLKDKVEVMPGIKDYF